MTEVNCKPAKLELVATGDKFIFLSSGDTDDYTSYHYNIFNFFRIPSAQRRLLANNSKYTSKVAPSHYFHLDHVNSKYWVSKLSETKTRKLSHSANLLPFKLTFRRMVSIIVHLIHRTQETVLHLG